VIDLHHCIPADFERFELQADSPRRKLETMTIGDHGSGGKKERDKSSTGGGEKGRERVCVLILTPLYPVSTEHFGSLK